MPEGHTIHRLARRHARLMVGSQVSADSPQGRFEDGARLLDGRTLGGLPCRICGTPVLDATIAARRLFWCPVCQA